MKLACWWAVLVVAFSGLFAPAMASSNMLMNGSFEDKDNPLNYWKYKYDPTVDKQAGWYVENHTRVKVEPEMDTRKGVLSLWGDYGILQAPGQGTKVDSFAVLCKLNRAGKYRFSCWAKTTGPDCRILLEGYKWRPGIKPHADPKLAEIRKVYKFSQLYFGKEKSGTMGAVGRSWKEAETTFPDDDASEDAKKNLELVQFLVVHVVAIGGSEGNLYVDDVRIEKIK